MSDVIIIITNLNGEPIEIIANENSTIKELKKAYAIQYDIKVEKIEGVIDEFIFKLTQGEKILNDDITLEEVLKDKVTITAVRRLEPITNCLRAINEVNAWPTLPKLMEILRTKIGTDMPDDTPIFASSNKDVVLKAVQKNSEAFEYAADELKADRDFILIVVQINGPCLEHASEELRKDKDVVLKAVQQFGLALDFASEVLRADREIVLEAVGEEYVFAFDSAADELKADRDFVLKVVSKCGFSLAYAADKLKADKEFMLAAMQQNGLALQYAPKELQNDYEIVLRAVKQNGLAIAYASEDLRKDSKIGSEAMKQDLFAPKSASKELKSGIINESPLEALKKPSIIPTGAPASISSSDSKAKQPNPKLNI
jgi:hypothetical protein